MKSYAEFLRGFMGKKGFLNELDSGWTFFIKKSASDSGEAKLVDVGLDYAEFSLASGHRFVPLNLLILEVE